MDDTPVYNLKAVVLETGLKPDTLRAWERRYGLPTPNRSDGGHRLYSERDIQVLKWLVARQQAGLSISRAAELWQRLSESGQDPAEMPEYAPAHRLAHAPLMLAGQALEDLRSAWVQACLAFDEQRAEAALNQALAQSPVENVGLGGNCLSPGWPRSATSGIAARRLPSRNTSPRNSRCAASRACWRRRPAPFGTGASWSPAHLRSSTRSCRSC